MRLVFVIYFTLFIGIFHSYGKHTEFEYSLNEDQTMCAITDLMAGQQFPCDTFINTYSQEIIVTYENPPATGSLVVNGIPHAITGSPQTVLLSGLISDGQSVTVSAFFSEENSCTTLIENVFISPENCCPFEIPLGEDRLVCENDNEILNAGDGSSYLWFVNGNLINNFTSMLEVTEEGNYLVLVTNSTGCQKPASVDIGFFDSPDAVDLREDFVLCIGSSTTLESQGVGELFEWFFDGNIINGENTNSLTISAGGEYILQATNTDTLPDMTVFSCVESDTVNVTLVTRPIVDLGPDLEVCNEDLPITLDAGPGGDQYGWNINGISVFDETEQTLEVSEAGTYIAIVDNGGGCIEQDTIVITVAVDAEVFAGIDIDICESSVITLGSVINAASFEWFFNGELFSDQSTNPTVTSAGEYVVVGENDLGCEVTDTVIVTIIIPPVLNLMDTISGCIGEIITLSVDSTGSIIWQRDGLPFSSNASVDVAIDGEYAVTVIAGPNCATTDTTQVLFSAQSSVDLGMDIERCSGEEFILSADTDANELIWFLDGVEIMGENDLDLAIDTDGSYIAFANFGGACESSDTVNVSFFPTTTLELEDMAEFCSGSSTPISVTSDATSFEWFLDGVLVGSTQEIDVDQGGLYFVNGLDDNGCIATDSIEVIELESADVSIDDSFTFCEGDSIIIMADGNGDTFEWMLDGNTLPNTSNTITIFEEGILTVTASIGNQCTMTASTSITTSMATIVDLGEDLSLCPGESIELFAGDGTSFNWSTEESTSSITVENNGVMEMTTEEFSVTVTNDGNCTSMDEISITFIPDIEGSVDQSTSEVCRGDTVVLTAKGGTSYEWNDNGTNTLFDINGPNAISIPTESVIYEITIRNDCMDQSISSFVIIDVFEVSDDISAGEDDCVIEGQTISLNASGGVAYMWEENDALLDGIDTPNPTVQPDVETEFFVNITDENGCTIIESVTICISETPEDEILAINVITPNGDGDNDVLFFPGLELLPGNELVIYNRWGFEVFAQSNYQSGGPLWDGTLNGKDLPTDTYYYILKFNEKTIKSPITILR